MSVGEALVYGLLGGTKAASEHYVTDWRERTKEARHLASQKEGWDYQEKLKRETAKELADYERMHKDKNVQLAVGSDGKSLVPITPDEETGAIPIPVAQITGDKFAFLGTGSSSKNKGLLGSSSKTGAFDPKTVKATTDMGAVEGSVEHDANGNAFQYIYNPETSLLEKVPVITRANNADIHSQEKLAEADAFADKMIDDISGWFSSDATDFSAWGGSREAAKEYFKKNYLKDEVFDQQGKLRLPGSKEQPETGKDKKTDSKQSQQDSLNFFQSLNPQKQNYVQKFINAIDQGKDPAALRKRMIDLGFTDQELNTLFPELS